jgi:hypothetical protein
MATKKAKAEKVVAVEAAPVVIAAWKGFDANLQCHGGGSPFQFEVGKTYEQKGAVKACSSGFHACEYPLDVLSYYPAAGSRFASVEQSGSIDRHEGDSKVASSTISVKAEISLPGLISAAIEYTMSRVNPALSDVNKDERGSASNSGYSGAASNSGDSGAASNSGDRGAASNSGYSGAASNSGYSGAASNSGNSGAASNSGNSGAASNSGYSGAASNSGKAGIAADFNGWGKAKSCASGAIVCVNRDGKGNIRHIRASKVGENGIEADVWYSLDAAGEFVAA